MEASSDSYLQGEGRTGKGREQCISTPQPASIDLSRMGRTYMNGRQASVKQGSNALRHSQAWHSLVHPEVGLGMAPLGLEHLHSGGRGRMCSLVA